jgi:phage shock protein PspC (stress-responsive transcriptional regulator)
MFFNFFAPAFLSLHSQIVFNIFCQVAEQLQYILNHDKSEKFMPLTKSRNKMIAGVCGGLAEWLGWSPNMVRILYVVVSVLSAAFPGILVYLILWMVMPPPSR